MKIKVGQIWYHLNDPNCQYQVVTIEKTLGGWIAKADRIDETGKVIQSQVNLVNINADGTGRWSPHWMMKYPPNSFSRVSRKWLQKRMRDQMAGEVLTHRLTEEKPKPSFNRDNFFVFRATGGRTTMLNAYRYYQQQLIDSLTRLT